MSGFIARAASLAAVPVRTGSHFAAAASKVAFGADRDAAYTKATHVSVELLAAALAKARGPAMKFGQVLALLATTLPPEQARALAPLGMLYEDATPRPWSDIARHVQRDLPSGVQIDRDPVAAASLGQVHRGTWLDGTPIAVKVQYPDAHRIVRSDLMQLRTLIPLIHRVAPALNAKALLDEHAARLWEELDYTAEGRWQTRFADAWNAAHPGTVTIPAVLHARSGMLVTEWLDGVPYASLPDASEAERDAAGRALARFTFWSPRVAGAVHADPHPGNFRLLPDGTLGVLDFGSVGFPAGRFTWLLAETFRLGSMGDDEAVHALWVADGMATPDTTPEELMRILAFDPAPYTQPVYAFTRERLASRAGEWADAGSALRDVSKLALPSDFLLEHRAIGGTLALLSSIEATVDFRAVIDGVGMDMPASPSS